jgi:molybdenum cofactor biosynthesis enzyme MoaA
MSKLDNQNPTVYGGSIKLEDIGFYTLSNERAINSSSNSPLWRCELILTDRCNFKCPYCNGIRKDVRGTLSLSNAIRILDLWISEGLRNVRFSGGEPTLYPHLRELVKYCKKNNVEHIAISTNGSADLEYYRELNLLGVNDFSISLDSGCCSVGKKLTGGVEGAWEKVVNNIREISKFCYTTVGMVFTEQNIDTAVNDILFAVDLGISDIRIISSNQYNAAIKNLQALPKDVVNKYPILKYRVEHYVNNRPIRGISQSDSDRCKLVLDDMAIAGNYHFPCIIYLRQHGAPIGVVSNNMRKEREDWFKNHDTHKDKICRENCLDVCVDFNNCAKKK